MSFKHLLGLALLAPAAAWASEQSPASGPAAEAVSGQAPRYASAFAAYRPYEEPEQQPDRVWRAANQQVGELRGHGGHLADMPAVGDPAGKPGGAAATTSSPAPGKPSAPAASGHQH